MNPKIRNIIIIVLLVAIVVTFHIVRRNATMRGIECEVVHDGAPVPERVTLFTSGDVDSIIRTKYPYLLATDIKDVDKQGIRKMLEKHPYVLEASVRMSTGGKLLVEVEQRIPVVRMFYQDNEFYLSRQGTAMPLSENRYCHVLVGSTLMEEPKVKRPLSIDLTDTAVHHQPVSPLKIWTLASFLYDNPQYGDLFDQVVVDDKGDLCLVPKLGDFTVVVGDTTRLEQKFQNMQAFLEQGVKQVGWDTYSSICLKYRDQVVCTRRGK